MTAKQPDPKTVDDRDREDHDHDDHDHDDHDHDDHDHDDHDHDDHDHDDHDHDDHDHDDHDHDDHGHAHRHGHHHDHHAVPATVGRAFALGVALNLAFVVIGVVAGVWASSTALLADAAHNLGDVLGLGMAWGATVLARRAPTERRTYGMRRTTILAALANATLLLVAIGAVAWEAILRFGEPHPVAGGIVAVVAVIGVAINALAALLFAKGRADDVNVRGAFLHLVADAAVSAGVVVAGVVIWRTGWTWVDPAASLAVSVVILVGTWSLFREAMDLLLDAVPAHVDPAAVQRFLGELPGVCEVHDLHIWSMSTTEVALTAHLVVAPDGAAPDFLRTAAGELERRFRIAHVTIQVEPPDSPQHCRQAAAGSL